MLMATQNINFVISIKINLRSCLILTSHHVVATMAKQRRLVLMLYMKYKQLSHLVMVCLTLSCHWPLLKCYNLCSFLVSMATKNWVWVVWSMSVPVRMSRLNCQGNYLLVLLNKLVIDWLVNDWLID